MDIKALKVAERRVKSAKDFTDAEILELRKAYKNGYYGRFTNEALMNECKRRRLYV